MVTTHRPTSKSSSPFNNPFVTIFNNVVVWMVSTRLISEFTSPFNNLLVTVPRAPITIGITVTFMFHSFFQFPSKVKVLILFFQFLSILFSGQPGQQSPQICKFSFFWPRLGDPFLCQSPTGVYVCHSPGQMLGCAYTICLSTCITPSGSSCPPSHV